MILDDVKKRLGNYAEVFFPLKEVDGIFTQVTGRNGVWELAISVEPTDELARLIRLNVKVLKPDIQKLQIPETVVFQWVNSKNSDLNFGRYFFVEGMLQFEEALPVSNTGVCWEVFDEFLRIALFSVDDAIAQFMGVAERLKGGE